MQPEEKGKKSFLTKKIKDSTGFVIILAAAAILFGGAYTWSIYNEPNDYDYSSDVTASIASKDRAEITKDWKTYQNNDYGLSFKYPENLSATNKNGYSTSLSAGDLARYNIEIFPLGGQTARQFVDSYFRGIEAGPSEIQETTIGNHPVIKFFMEKANINGHAGSAIILFKNGSYGITLSTISKMGTAQEIMADKTLANIASTIVLTDPAAGWQTYSGQYEGMSLKYPSTWKLVATEGTSNEIATRVGWTGPFDGFTLTGPNNFVITYTTHIDGIGGGCDEGVNCIHAVYYNVSEMIDANYQGLKLQQVELREPDNKTVRFRMLGLWNPISDKSIVPKTGNNIEGFFAMLYHDKGADKILSELTGQFGENNRHNELSTKDYFNLPDVAEAAEIMKTVKFR